MRHVRHLGSSLGLAFFTPAAAVACPVCFSAASERVLHSYYGTAVALTLLPLLLVGAFVAWLARATGGRSQGERRETSPDR
jgi:hypothetical protein